MCASCQRGNDPWRRHCGGCGSGLPGGCPICGAVNRSDDRFCGGCAHPLRSKAARPGPSPTEAGTTTVKIDITELLPIIPQD